LKNILFTLILTVTCFSYSAFGQKLSCYNLISFINKDFEFINDILIQKSYTFNGTVDLAVYNSGKQTGLHKEFEWVYNPNFDKSTKFLKFQTIDKESEKKGTIYPKKISYTIFNNLEYTEIKNQFIQKGFKKGESKVEKDNNGSDIISVKYGTYEYILYIYTLLNGRYQFDLKRYYTVK
jgi:hypothetical protein